MTTENDANLRIYYQILCCCLGGLDVPDERRAVAMLLGRTAKRLGWKA